MIGQTNKKKIIFSSLLIFVALLLTTPIHTLALQPEEVDVVIRITWFQTLWKDTDLTSAGDVYFKIIHDTETSTSGTAWNDYEDEGDFELDNDDFDGNGYYNQQYWDVDLDTGYLTWIIEAWDEDTFGDDLIFKGRLTIKDPGTTGSYSNDEVLAYYYEVWVNNDWVDLSYGTYNSYLHFQWLDGPIKKFGSTAKRSNGLMLWISLYYTT